MKRYLFVALILMCMSCSKNIEDDAMNHLKSTMKEMVIRSDEAELVDGRTYGIPLY